MHWIRCLLVQCAVLPLHVQARLALFTAHSALLPVLLKRFPLKRRLMLVAYRATFLLVLPDKDLVKRELQASACRKGAFCWLEDAGRLLLGERAAGVALSQHVATRNPLELPCMACPNKYRMQ